MLHHHTFSPDSISFQKAPVNSFNWVFANTVYSLGNPIITFLLSFCLSAILSFWKAPFRERGPFYLLLKGFKPAPPLLNGWEQAGPGFLWVTQLTMEQPGPGLLHIQPLFDGHPAPWLHPCTLSAYCHAKQQLLLQPRTTSHRSLKKERSPSLALLCPTATNACNFFSEWGTETVSKHTSLRQSHYRIWPIWWEEDL